MIARWFLALQLLAPVCLAAEGSWKAVGWGGGGFFWSCAFHPTRDGVIYLGGDVAGAYKTEDKGKHWRFINRGLADYAVYALAASKASPDTLYAGTVSGLCKSTDGGATWRDITSDLPYVKPLLLRFNPATGDLWAGGVGLFKTPRPTAPRASSTP
ncbi:MAG: hypothetical protein FJ290_06915 [Planctomycetes bacterium]|nr:hypothetical protein [Planctomycetota bacterium]